MTEQRDKIIKGIRKKLQKSRWSDYLWQYWNSREWQYIIDTLIIEVQENRRWLPGADFMLRFMQECPVDKLKAVFLVDKVSIVWEGYDGIPLSSKGKEVPYKANLEIQQTIPGQSDNPKYITDMAVWANQGVLMIPTALTAEIGRDAHYNLWSPFVSYLIGKINKDYSNIPWVLMGRRAVEYSDMIKTDKKIQLTFKKMDDSWVNMWPQINEWIVLNEQMPVSWII